AAIMNEHFVNVKVDREERPDVDGIYMQAVQAMTGQGGWPMTVFLTPDGEPFWGGTYFPPEDRHGLPSFQRVLLAVAESWRDRRDKVHETAQRMRDYYAAALGVPVDTGAPTEQTLDRAYRALAQRFDERNGGFEGAPKFPPAMPMDFLLRVAARTDNETALEMVHRTFIHMARGGIFDQVGGGFHRYSVDAVWLVPHFEKMLYDNALLARLGVHLWQATADAEVRLATEATLDWVLREMRAEGGGFCSALDADSEGGEGAFYVWPQHELQELLGADADAAMMYWGAHESANFEGRCILHVPNAPSVVAARLHTDVSALMATIDRARATLASARETRSRPLRDDKVIAAWNGWMLRAFAEAARVFGRSDYREVAIETAQLLAGRIGRDGRVPRVLSGDGADGPGFLEDHASLSLAFADVYALTGDRRWLDEAAALARATIARFYEPASGRFFDTASDHEALVTRPRAVSDNATPSGNSLAVEMAQRLGVLLGDESLLAIADAVLRELSESMVRFAPAFGHLLGAADSAVYGPVEVAIVGERKTSQFETLSVALAQQYVPSLVLASGDPDVPRHDSIPLLEGRQAGATGATAYVCRRYVCSAPTADPAELREQLQTAVTART
ncbi:MAG TPA: thioredoxin domain-containing protein, partial [Gemmatimonadaceae bacterium]|nr:thioredoxin domain-containing protein [Gemmatimonadaceae bacterium]